jgi:chromosome segregation ATPase
MEIETLHEQLKSNSSAMKIRELEEVITTMVDEKRDLMIMNQSLENSTANYIKTISDLETNLMKLQQSESELRQKMEYAKTETQDVRQELQNYKLRAQNQLQMKEKLIEQLKSGDVEAETEGVNDMSALQMEIDQIRSERDHLQTELNLVSKRMDESRSFIEKLEHKHRIMEASAEDKINALNDTISQLNNASAHFEDEIRIQKQEIQQVREEMLSQKKFMTTKLHEKENELKRLKNAYRESQLNSEIENRVQSLSQSLITKQTNLEAITADRNALKLQLEKLSVRFKFFKI